MSQYHILCESIWKQGVLTSKNSIDKAIREFLEEATKKLSNSYSTFGGISDDYKRFEWYKHILGLTEVKEEPHPTYPNIKVVEPKESKWCEHQDMKVTGSDLGTYYFGMSGWKFCPICGTPRPTIKPLRERLAEKLSNRLIAWRDDSVLWSGIGGQMAEELADIAIDFLEKEKP